MSSMQKLFLSLLLTIVAFTGFIFVSYFGLFEYLETHFYNVKIQEDIQRSLDRTEEHITQYHRVNQEKFKSIMEIDFIKTVYFLNQSREHIFNRESLFGKLKAEQTSFAGVRFIDFNLEKLHFSTFPEDILRKTGTNIEYRNLKDVEDGAFIETLKKKAIEEPIIIHAPASSFVYCFKAFDIYAKHAGYALFYVGKLGLQNYLLKNGDLDVGDKIELVDGIGILLKAQSLEKRIIEAVQKYWQGDTRELPSFVVENGEAFRLFESRGTTFFKIGIFLPNSIFGLTTTLKVTIFVCTFITLFLLFFLLFNLKQEPVLIVSERIKKLQLNLLWEYLERNQEIDWKKIQLELENRREEVKNEILKGVGRVKKEDRPKLESLFDKSWDEILAVLGNKAQATAPSVDLSRLTELIEQALQKITVIPVPSVSEKAGDIPKAPASTVGSAPMVPEKETAGEEEIEELAEVEEGEEVKGVEEVEAIEEISEVEEVEEVEEVKEAEPLKEVEEAEEVEEVEEVEELEVAEEIEELEVIPVEAEETEEVEEAERVEETEEAEDTKVLEEVKEVEEVEEAEPVGEAEELELLEEAEDWGILEELAEEEAPPRSAAKTFPSRRELLLSKHLFGGPSFTRIKGKPSLSGTVSIVTLYEGGYCEYIELGALAKAGYGVAEEEVIVTKPDGLIQIDDRTFTTEWIPKDRSLKGLVDQVMRGTEREEPVEATKETGIDGLFEGMDVSLEDLFGEVPPEEGIHQGENTEESEGKENAMMGSCLSPEGYFLLNQYFRNYKRDETGIHKALVRLSQYVSSPICVVLAKKEGDFFVRFSVGLPQPLVQTLQLHDGPYFGRMFRKRGSMLRIKYPMIQIEEFSKESSLQNIVKDLVPIFIPYLDRNEKGMVLLATKISSTMEEYRSLFLDSHALEVSDKRV